MKGLGLVLAVSFGLGNSTVLVANQNSVTGTCTFSGVQSNISKEESASMGEAVKKLDPEIHAISKNFNMNKPVSFKDFNRVLTELSKISPKIMEGTTIQCNFPEKGKQDGAEPHKTHAPINTPPNQGSLLDHEKPQTH